ncbi:hypothetical protein AAKU55_002806 [Oxalobacteraceae bacterium GrIS 1.11]
MLMKNTQTLYRQGAMLAVAFACASAHAENTCNDGVAEDLARRLGHKASRPHYATCRAMPSEPGKNIIALAYLSPASDGFDPDDERGGSYDLDVLITATGSAKKVASARLEGRYESDAWRFSDLAIDTGRYRLTPAVRAFGLRATHASSSRANPGSQTSLDLFVEEGGELRQVLTGLVVQDGHGEWDTQCEGEFSDTVRSIDMGNSASHGYADLIVTSKTVDTVNKMVKGECAPSEKKGRATKVSLHYDGKAYVVPAALSQLQ